MSSCLHHYLASTTLPEMVPGCQIPLEGSRSHCNKLSTRPSAHRKLEMIHTLNDTMFGFAISDFMHRNIPKCAPGAMDMDPVTRERFAVPNEPGFPVTEINLQGPCNMMDLHLWFYFLPLKTVQRTIHLIYPQTKEYRAAIRGFNDVDSNIFQYIKWGIHNPHQTDPDVGDPTPNLILAFQPPWILSPQDLEYFVRCRKFPPFDVQGDNTNFNSRERLWAKIWDLCVNKDCHYFVLTSYDSWVFGVFSTGWTRAFISPIRKYSDNGPTVLECLIYWICSSMDMQGGFKVPEVSELVQSVSGTHPIPAPPSGLSSVQPSESWSGDSKDIEYNSYDDSRSDDTIGPINELPHPIPLAVRVAQDTEKVQHWFTDQLSTHEMLTPEDWREYSPAPSDASDVSAASGVKGYGNDEVWQGGWLTGDPGEARGHVYVH